MTTRIRLIDAAKVDLGKPAPTNTCVSKGAYPWATRIGLPYPEYSDGNGHSSANVSDLVRAAELGLAGWKKVAVSDARPGDFLIWYTPELGEYHISVFSDLVDARKRSIGAGGPSGKVAYQPGTGGGNLDSVFSCALRPPFSDDVETDADKVRRIARYLNDRLGGLDSTAEKDGVRGEVYWKLLQTAGRQDGLFPKPAYVIDGKPGARSRYIESVYDKQVTR